MSGIFGVVSKKNCVETLFYGVDYHSHLGTEFAGIAVLGDKFWRQIHSINHSQFKSKFYEDIKIISGNKGIGVISDLDEQPIYQNSKFGPFCIVTDGHIENASQLAKELFRRGDTFSEFSKGEVNATELVAKLIAQEENLIEGVEKMFRLIDGSCSLLLLNQDGIYAVRDRLGYTPLVVGKSEDAWAITTETSSFPNIGFSTMKYLQPGEIVLINESGIVTKITGNEEMQVCAFLWIYTGFPASSYQGINVEIVRERCGKILAQRDRGLEIDFVSGVPDSGTSHALGYAMESGKPFRRPLIKYTPGYGRSYTPISQATRDLIATMKLIPVRDIIEGSRIVVCEDSIVRGTQLRNFTIKKLWDNGAKEVHVRVACPPLMFPCRFNLSTRTTSELAARRAIRALEGHDLEEVSEYLNIETEKYKKMVSWIAKDLGVTTLKYQTLQDMIKAIGLPREKLCLYCWNGEYPRYSLVKENVSRAVMA